MAEHQQTDEHRGHDSSGRPGQHNDHETHDGMKHGDHKSSKDHEGHKDHEGGDHHAHMVADFRRRFWVSLGITIPILVLSPMIQASLGTHTSFGRFPRLSFFTVDGPF